MEEVLKSFSALCDYSIGILDHRHLDRKQLVPPIFSYKDFFMINEALRLIRVFHDCKVSELAENLGMSASFISEIESGRKKPSLETLQKYASHFDITVSSIMFFSEDLDKKDKKNVKSTVREKMIKFLQMVERVTED